MSLYFSKTVTLILAEHLDQSLSYDSVRHQVPLSSGLTTDCLELLLVYLASDRMQDGDEHVGLLPESHLFQTIRDEVCPLGEPLLPLPA